jgi:hypothetical protein
MVIMKPLIAAHRSCRGNHEGKEGMEWKVSRESLIAMGWLPTGQTGQAKNFCQPPCLSLFLIFYSFGAMVNKSADFC